MAIRYTYSSNGQGIYGIDMETGKEGETPTYPTPDELWNRTFAKANDWRDRLPPCRIRIRAAHGRSASTKKFLSTACWRP